MSKQVENWAHHVEQLKMWNKPITDYAKSHHLNVARLYYWRDVLNKNTKVAPMRPTAFIPIKIKPPEVSANIFSVTIKNNGLSFELNDVSLETLKELITLKVGA